MVPKRQFKRGILMAGRRGSIKNAGRDLTSNGRGLLPVSLSTKSGVALRFPPQSKTPPE
jgi:hypothetical protein